MNLLKHTTMKPLLTVGKHMNSFHLPLRTTLRLRTSYSDGRWGKKANKNDKCIKFLTSPPQVCCHCWMRSTGAEERGRTLSAGMGRIWQRRATIRSSHCIISPPYPSTASSSGLMCVRMINVDWWVSFRNGLKKQVADGRVRPARAAMAGIVQQVSPVEMRPVFDKRVCASSRPAERTGRAEVKQQLKLRNTKLFHHLRYGLEE